MVRSSNLSVCCPDAEGNQVAQTKTAQVTDAATIFLIMLYLLKTSGGELRGSYAAPQIYWLVYTVPEQLVRIHGPKLFSLHEGVARTSGIVFGACDG